MPKEKCSEFERSLDWHGYCGCMVAENGANVVYLVLNISLDMLNNALGFLDVNEFIFAKILENYEVLFQRFVKFDKIRPCVTDWSKHYFESMESQRHIFLDEDTRTDNKIAWKNSETFISSVVFKLMNAYDDMIDTRCVPSKEYETEWESLLNETLNDSVSPLNQVASRSELYGRLYWLRFENPEDKPYEVYFKDWEAPKIDGYK